MKQFSIRQLPNTVRALRRDGVRTQYAALCYRVNNDKVEVLLITSRGTGRWILPKGWPIDGKSPAESAAQEAWEEAGVIGKLSERCLGLFAYVKEREEEDDLPCVAMVYPVKVRRLASDYPEEKERRRKWFSPKKAAQKVAEPELARILAEFDPRALT